MANSLYVPMATPPADLAEIEALVVDAFQELGLSRPSMRLHRNDGKPAIDLSTSVVMIEGSQPEDFCWTSVDAVPTEVTEDAERPYLIDVTTRGSWKFAGAVAYAFCKHAGGCVFNDSGVLDGTHVFDAESLRSALLR
jgi:hypothetical protein